MRSSGLGRIIIGVVLGAYLGTGILSPRVPLVQMLHGKFDNSLSFQNERSIDIDETPYWTSHKHLTTPELFSSDHIICAAEPWVSVITPELSFEIQSAILPIPAPFSPSNAFRAPPRS